MTTVLVPAIVLTVELATTVFVAWRLTRRSIPAGTDPLERATVGLLIGLLTIVGVSQLTAALGIFSRLWILVAHLIVAGVVAWKVPATPSGSRSPSRPGWRPTGDGACTVIVIAGCSALLALATYVSLRRPTTEFDSLQYHFPDSVHWLQHHALWSLPVLSAPYADNAYPSNAELLSSWLMQPTHTSTIALFQPLAFGVLTVLGAALLARNLKGRAWIGALGGLVVVASPIFYLNVDSLMTDLAGASGVVVGIAILLSARGVTSPGRRLFLAGLAIGLSAGSKDTALAFAALSVVWIVVAPPSTAAPRWRLAGVLLAGIILPAIVWFGRDGIALGNPLYPEGVSVFGHQLLTGTSSPYTVYKTTMFEHFVHLDGGALHTWWRGVLDQLGPTAFLSTLGIVVGPAGARVRRDRGMAAVALIAAAGTVLYLLTPYTGGGRQGNATLITAQLRYDLVPLVLGAVLLAVVLPRWLSLVVLVPALVVEYNRQVLTATALHGSRLITLGVLVALQLVLIAVIVAAGRGFGPWPDLTCRLRLLAARAASTRRRAVVAGAAAVVAVIGVGIVLRSGVSYPGRVPPALAAVAPARGPILELGVTNVAQLFGPHLDRRIATVGLGSDGNRNPDRATFLRYLAGHRPAAIVISPLQESLDPGYLDAVRPPPQSWVRVANLNEIGGVPDQVYVPR